VIRNDGTNTYALAQADSEANAEVIGIVTTVTDANNFIYKTNGMITGLSGLTAETVYYLSPSSAGALTATEPTTIGQVSKPILIATSTTAGVLLIMRGYLISANSNSWTTVTKLVDESVASNATVQADDELFFTPVSGGMYEFQLFLIYASPAGGGTPDFQVAFGQDGTMRGTLSLMGPSTGDGAAATTLQAQTGSTGSYGTATSNRMLMTLGGVYFGSGAQAGVYWAQTNSGVNATILRAGSMLWYRRIL
jgi:hypothetical protein